MYFCWIFLKIHGEAFEEILEAIFAKVGKNFRKKIVKISV